jgi:predicted amino acid racemase
MRALKGGANMDLPILSIDTRAIYENTAVLVEACRKAGLDVFAVTKAVGGLPAAARAMLSAGAAGIADSRVANLERLRKSGIGAPLMLLRSPTAGESSRAAAAADIILVSALPGIAEISRAADKQGSSREIRLIPMVEMGDRREGIMPELLNEVVEAADKLPGVRIRGLGANFACLAGAVPTVDSLRCLEELAKGLEGRYAGGLVLSAGNSSALSLVFEGRWPRLSYPAHLRVGESILLGWDIMTKEPLPGLRQDAFRFYAEVIEVAKKPSLPAGPVGCNAFDEQAEPVDRGCHWRAVVAAGRQDIGAGSLIPLDPGVEILGMTSDHTVLAVDEAESSLAVGTCLEFRLDYGGLLGAMTSPYVGKIVKE